MGRWVTQTTNNIIYHTAARVAVAKHLAQARKDRIPNVYFSARIPPSQSYRYEVEDVGKRALVLTLLSFYRFLNDEPGQQGQAHAVLAAHFHQANNMTDISSALALLADTPNCLQAPAALDAFEERFLESREALDVWFLVQATSTLPNPRARLEKLMQHPKFAVTNPNKVKAVFAMLGTSAPSVLYTQEVLQLLGDVICQTDPHNPNTAAMLTKQLLRWRSLPPSLQEDARAVLQRIADRPGCSKNAAEVVSKALG